MVVPRLPQARPAVARCLDKKTAGKRHRRSRAAHRTDRHALITEKTILVVENDDSTRAALVRILHHQGYAVRDFNDATVFIDSINPAYGNGHCVILDMHMNDRRGIRGLEIQKKLLEQGLRIPVIFISGESRMSEAITAFRQGAADFLLKPLDMAELLAAVANALTPSLNDSVQNDPLLKKLSKREKEVLKLVLAGLRSQPIADALGISLRTVKMHRGNLMAKLGVSNVTALLALLSGNARRSS